jgi:hypothetical protein
MPRPLHERDRPLVAALLTPRPGEPIREDAALEVAAEVALATHGGTSSPGVSASGNVSRWYSTTR